MLHHEPYSTFAVLFLLQNRGLSNLEYVLFWGLLGVVLAIVVWLHIYQLRRLNSITAIMRLFEAYSTSDMYEAIQALWNQSVEYFHEDEAHKNQRRIVFQFWRMVAVLTKRRVIQKRVVFALYGDAIEIWTKLRPLDEEIKLAILLRDHPERTKQELLPEAKTAAASANADLEWLYSEWLKWKARRARSASSH